MARILVVDDDMAVAEVIVLVLSNAGHETTRAANLTEARAALENTEFDGVLIDVWLGEDDGLTLAQELEAHPAQTPFAIMSGGGPRRTLETVTARADSLGASGVLFKPFEDDELLGAIEKMAGGNA